MILKNTVEDIVLIQIEEILKIKDGFYQSPIFKHDLAAFVLNRIKPKYLMSNRGLLHYEKELTNNEQLKADIISLIIKGIDLISNRRHLDFDYDKADFPSEEAVEEYYYNFPHFFGRVLSSCTMSSICDVEVTLFNKIDENIYEHTKMINSNWTNPYYIAKETNGYYTFWVKPVLAEKQDGPSEKTFNFKMNFNHKNLYEPFEIHFSINITSEKYFHLKIQKDFFKKFEDILLNV